MGAVFSHTLGVAEPWKRFVIFLVVILSLIHDGVTLLMVVVFGKDNIFQTDPIQGHIGTVTQECYIESQRK